MVVAAEEIQPILDQAALTAPDDDRVWLARAYLATQYGRYPESRRYLDAVHSRRLDRPSRPRAPSCNGPLPPAIPEEACACAGAGSRPERIAAPEPPVPPRLVRRASQRPGPSDRPSSNSSRSIPATPGARSPGLVGDQAGDLDRAAAFRRRQEESLRDKERYRRLMIEDHDPIPRDELHERARLAERLGRWFEAQGWLTLALEHELRRPARPRRTGPTRPDAASRSPSQPGASLLDLVGESGDPAARGREAGRQRSIRRSARRDRVPRRCRCRRALLHLRQWRIAAASDPRDDRRGRRRSRL